MAGSFSVMVARGPSTARRTVSDMMLGKIPEPVAKSDRARHIAARRKADDLYRPTRRYAFRAARSGRNATDRGAAGLRACHRRHDRRRPGGSRQACRQRPGAAQPRRRQGGRQARERRGADGPGICRHLQGVRRGRLEFAPLRSRVRRSGNAVAAGSHGAGDVAGGQHGLRPGAAAEPGRHRRHPPSRFGRPEIDLPAQDDLGRMDGDHEPHRAAGGLGPRPAQEPGGEEGRPLPGDRPEDLHHLRRARHGRQHRAPGPGAHARRAGRRARHLAVHRAEVPGRRRRQAWLRATTCAACRWSTSSASMPARPA